MLIDTIVHTESIEKGWSGDRKYRATDQDGHHYLLRISSPERHARREAEFHRMRQVEALGIPMCRGLEFGCCDNGVYSLQSWIDGADAQDILPTLSPEKQYAYGVDAGQTLRKIHSLPAPGDAGSWSERFNRKIDRKIAMYASCPLKYDGGEAMLSYLAANRHLLDNRPQSYQHGDYHSGNMMIDSAGVLTVIDFDKDDFGDPWEEFNRIVWCVKVSSLFASGMVDGYFAGDVPEEFWALLALYICSNTIGSLPWAIPFGEEEVRVMYRQAEDVLSWYDHMRTTLPSWYRKP